jgi:polyhydroxybutyrate depolymerase
MTHALLVTSLLFAAEPLTPGDHQRPLTVEGRERSYLVHVPPRSDANRPLPVVLVLHGAFTNAEITVAITGMNAKADEAGFLAVYPNGTGRDPVLTWNAWGRQGVPGMGRPDDVKYIRCVLDDLATVAHVDPKRVYATGLSNGGMMCYRLAAELSDRIAAIAPVAGTLALADAHPSRPVPVMHFHGTDDKIVPAEGTGQGRVIRSVDETIRLWCRVNGCPTTPAATTIEDRVDDGTSVACKVYGPGNNDAEVVLYEIVGGGHTWPGQIPPVRFLGRSTLDISANDLMWEFFQRHPLP